MDKRKYSVIVRFQFIDEAMREWQGIQSEKKTIECSHLDLTGEVLGFIKETMAQAEDKCKELEVILDELQQEWLGREAQGNNPDSSQLYQQTESTYKRTGNLHVMLRGTWVGHEGQNEFDDLGV